MYYWLTYTQLILLHFPPSILLFCYDEKSLITANEKKALCSQTSLILQGDLKWTSLFRWLFVALWQCVICSLEDVSTIKPGR
ncbi:hypothetical protein P8452_77367 [Trifolium repens]|nr:hypothetical protein P8452_10987 [Trifolium repens]WJX96123.1 hypothetical protein P8452_77367 [Trifolium repens]